MFCGLSKLSQTNILGELCLGSLIFVNIFVASLIGIIMTYYTQFFYRVSKEAVQTTVNTFLES